MADAAEQTILVTANVTASEFFMLSAIAEACSWLAQGAEWRSVKAYDIVLSLSDFFKSPQITNASESAPQLAEYLGTTEDRAQYMLSFLSNIGYPLPDAVEAIKEVMPAAGHPANNSDLFIGIFVMFTVLLAAFVGLRLYSRMVVGGFIRAYDWVLLFAVLVTIGFGAMNAACIAGPTHLRGRWDRSWEEFIVNSYSGKATEVLYPVGVFLIKASLLLFYWGLTTWWPLRISAAVIFVISLGNSLAMIFTAVLRCKPVLSFDGYDYFTASCNTEMWAKGEEICGSINIATDIVIWLMPLPMVWKITQGLRERLLASLTFGIGALACIACGLRFSGVQEYREYSLIPRDQSRWLIWAMTEMNLAILCSCVPAIRALIIKKAPSIIGSTAVYTEDGKLDKSDDKEKGPNVNIDSASDR
ncbi:hypothetical protein ABW19_dt0208601 [Dactylella cylindrospora]|nr:hypothetical protein ABW19_dt0208601 [Dactylella cylindrospora]